MALRFRAFLPFAIPGVLALIGWWWFSSRRKERANNHDRQDLPSLEEHRLVSAAEESHLGEDTPPSNELLLPLEAKEAAQSSIAVEPSGEPRAPSEQQAGCLDPSERDEQADARTTIELNRLRDDSEKLEMIRCQGISGSHVLESSPPAAQIGSSSRDEMTAEAKLDSTQVADQVPQAIFMTGVLLDSSHLEKPEDNGEDLTVRNDSEEEQCPSAGSLPIPCSDVAHKAPLDQTEREEMNGGAAVEMETTDVEMSREVETSSSKAGSMLNHYRYGDEGQKGGLEKEKIGGIRLDKEEIENIDQVAIHIISNVIQAATEEVLSGSVNNVSDRICQGASCVDKQLEKMCTSAECSTMSDSAAEKVPPLERPPFLEGSTDHTVFSSHLTHGLLGNPTFGQSQDSLFTGQPLSDEAVTTDQEEEIEDAHTSDSGCNACASEDGASAEDLLKIPLSPALQQCLDLLNMPINEDLEQRSALSRKPFSSTLAGNKVPYSNGVLKEECVPRGHEQAWSVEADAEHSGDSDVNSMDSMDSECALRKNGSCQNSKTGSDPLKTELVIWEIEIPKHLVGRLIGKQGRSVSFLKQASGAKIYISTIPYTQDFQICHIEGSQQNVDKALSLIGKKFKDLSLTNIYTPPPPLLPLHSLRMISWLMLPEGVTVEVIVVNQLNAGHLFVQQHMHPTCHVLRSLDQQMFLCYSQPGIPTLPTPVEVGAICAAPGVEGAWWRAQVVGYFKDVGEVEIRYVDYGGYERVKIDTLRQIRSDFVTLPFQGAEVLLDNVVPLPGDDNFSPEADTTVSEMTRGTPLLAQVTNCDSATGLPLIQLWSMLGDELVSINRTLVESGLAQWVENY
nr:A-kinase anchor protein 1, mitochondrial [Anolis sagrei ordinatus]